MAGPITRVVRGEEGHNGRHLLRAAEAASWGAGTWPWAFRDAAQLQPRRIAFVTDDPEAEVQAACGGFGFTQASEYLLRPPIERGELMRSPRRFEPQPWTLHVYRPQRGPVPTRVGWCSICWPRNGKRSAHPDAAPQQLKTIV